MAATDPLSTNQNTVALEASFWSGLADNYETATSGERALLLAEPDTTADGQRVNALSSLAGTQLIELWKAAGHLKRGRVYQGENWVDTYISTSVPTQKGIVQLTVPTTSLAAQELRGLGLAPEKSFKVNAERVLAREQFNWVTLPSSSTLNVSHLAAAYGPKRFGAPYRVLPAAHPGHQLLNNWVEGQYKVQLFTLETPRLNETRKNCNLFGVCIHGGKGLPMCALPPPAGQKG